MIMMMIAARMAGCDALRARVPKPDSVSLHSYDLCFQFEPTKLRMPRDASQREVVLYIPDRVFMADFATTHHRSWRVLYDFEVCLFRGREGGRGGRGGEGVTLAGAKRARCVHVCMCACHACVHV